jgi:DNA-binding NarL/FixJ family response regulator
VSSENNEPALANRSATSASPGRSPRVAFGAETASGSLGSAGERPQVLIVEDDWLVAMQVEAALTDAGFAVLGIANSAEEAIQMAQEGNPALAIMDIRLAGRRDGVDAAIQLFRERGLRCIFATAHFDQQIRQRADAAQPIGWIQKPYSMASLLDMIHKALGKPA